MTHELNNDVEIGMQYRHLLSCKEKEQLVNVLVSVENLSFENIDTAESLLRLRKLDDFLPLVKYVLSLDIEKHWNVNRAALLYVLPYANFLNKEIIDGLVFSNGFQNAVENNQSNIFSWFVPHRKNQSFLIRKDYLGSLNELFLLNYKNFIRMYQITHLMRAKDPSIKITEFEPADFWKQEFLSVLSKDMFYRESNPVVNESGFFELFNGLLYFYDETNIEDYSEDSYFLSFAKTIQKSLTDFENTPGFELVSFLKLSGIFEKYTDYANIDLTNFPLLEDWKERYPVDSESFDIVKFRCLFKKGSALSEDFEYVFDNYHYMCYLFALLNCDQDKFVQVVRLAKKIDYEIVYSCKFLNFVMEYAIDNSRIPVAFYANIEGIFDN